MASVYECNGTILVWVDDYAPRHAGLYLASYALKPGVEFSLARCDTINPDECVACSPETYQGRHVA